MSINSTRFLNNQHPRSSRNLFFTISSPTRSCKFSRWTLLFPFDPRSSRSNFSSFKTRIGNLGYLSCCIGRLVLQNVLDPLNVSLSSPVSTLRPLKIQTLTKETFNRYLSSSFVHQHRVPWLYLAHCEANYVFLISQLSWNVRSSRLHCSKFRANSRNENIPL